MATLRKVAQNSFLYTISSVLLRASSIIFFPIFSLYLTKSDYGILSITQSIGTFVTLFAGLELGKALTRFIFNESEKENSDHSSLIFTTLITSFAFGLIVVAFLSLSGPYILKPILNDIPFYPYVFLFLLSIPLNTSVNTCRVYLKANHRGYHAFILDTAFFSINILLNLFFVVIMGMDVLGIILGVLLNTTLFSLLLYFLFYRKYTFDFDKKILKSTLNYAIPLLPYSVLNILFESVDKFFLNAYLGSQASGIYYIALTFAAIFSSAKEAIINAFTPWLFANIREKPEKEIAKIISLIFAGAGFVAIGISWFSRELLTLLSSNPDFIVAYQYIPFTVIGLYIIFMGQLYNIKTFYYGKYNRYLFLATLAGIVADVIACYLLIKPYGIYGAVAARIIAFSVHVVVIVYLSNKEADKRNIYNTKLIIGTLLLACSVSLLPVVDDQTLTFTVLKLFFYMLMSVGFLFILNRKMNIVSLFLRKKKE
ncbi:MAG: oligosaccharide flippase family protein [Chitinophagales bacterium]